MDAQLREILENVENILETYPAAIFLPCFYRSAPPRIFLRGDCVQVLVKGERVLHYEVEPYDLDDRGYREIGSGAYRLVYEFLPGRRFELELEGTLLEKRLPDGGLAEEMIALRERLGYYGVVPLVEICRLEGRGGVGVSLRIKRLDPEVEPPSCAHPGDAGLDIRSAEDVVILPGERATVSTGFAMALPEGYAAFVQPRSGLAARDGISIVNTPGLIDCHYRGEVKVILINHGNEAFRVRRGDRIAQMVIQGVEAVRVEVVEELEDTTRGEGGFGSTGV